MLSAKPWKSEALVRLVICLLVCQFLGWVELAVVAFVKTKPAVNPWLFGALAMGSALGSLGTLFCLRKPLDLQHSLRPLVVVVFLFYLAMSLGAFAQHVVGKAGNEGFFLRTLVATLNFQGAALVFTWFFVRQHGLTLREAFGLNLNWKVALLAGVAVGCVYLPVGQLLQMLSAQLMTHWEVKPEVQEAVQALKGAGALLERILVGVAAIGLAPLAEEILFRGILYSGIKQAGYPRVALWGTSLLFAVIHGNMAAFVPLLLLSLVLTALYEWTNNLLAAITAHSVFNALNFVSFYLMQARLV